MSPPDSIDMVMAMTRSVLLIICALAGVLCIYLGWRLYMNFITVATKGEFAGLGLKLKLASGGPGAVISALGIWLLLSVVNRPIEISEGISTETTKLPIQLASQNNNVGSSPCFLYIKKRRFDSGLSDITPNDVEQATAKANAALRRAGSNGINDAEERSETIRILSRLGSIVREQNND
ncbi:hypothetical protein [Massilia sp. METH4]|uniref:hypothetical protein n=1 Tax=Massilia sp. METH4 TaxID=3123041 RepID=UPI0030D22704